MYPIVDWCSDKHAVCNSFYQFKVNWPHLIILLLNSLGPRFYFSFVYQSTRQVGSCLFLHIMAFRPDKLWQSSCSLLRQVQWEEFYTIEEVKTGSKHILILSHFVPRCVLSLLPKSFIFKFFSFILISHNNDFLWGFQSSEHLCYKISLIIYCAS